MDQEGQVRTREESNPDFVGKIGSDPNLAFSLFGFHSIRP
jgi:hypothetical protein